MRRFSTPGLVIGESSNTAGRSRVAWQPPLVSSLRQNNPPGRPRLPVEHRAPDDDVYPLLSLIARREIDRRSARCFRQETKMTLINILSLIPRRAAAPCGPKATKRRPAPARPRRMIPSRAARRFSASDAEPGTSMPHQCLPKARLSSRGNKGLRRAVKLPFFERFLIDATQLRVSWNR